MKIKQNIYCLLLLCYFIDNIPATFKPSTPYTIQTKQKFPWTAFFRSLFARKELALGKFPIKVIFEGYILHEPFWDSRQIIATADGLQLFAPKRELIGCNGKDINSVGEFNMSIVETRFRLKLYGPKVLGAETFGLIEVDFLGFDFQEAAQADVMEGDAIILENEIPLNGDLAGLATLNGHMRDRHAYVKLTWKEQHMTLWGGQYFHPIRLAHLDLDPKVISRNRGSPVHPNARDPQIRFTKAWKNKLNLVMTALSQLRNVSLGPIGPSSVYVRRSLMPIFNIQFWLGPESTKYVFGVGMDIKRLIPRLVTDKCVRTRESLTSVAFNAFGKLTAEPLSIRTQFAWVQNGTDYGMLGGYAVSSIDPITDKRTYTNINVLTYWIDFNLDKKISPGLFGGLTKNLGTGSPIIPEIFNPKTKECESLVFSLAPDIKYMAKVVPRIRIHFKPVIFGTELEWTRVGYGTLTKSGKIENVVPVSNVRLILASYFFF